MEVAMDIDLDLLFGFSSNNANGSGGGGNGNSTQNNNNTNNNPNSNNQNSSTSSSSTTIQLSSLTPAQDQPVNNQNENMPELKNPHHNLMQQQNQQIQLTSVTLTNETIQHLQQSQNRTNIVVLTPLNTSSSMQTIGQVIGTPQTLNLTSIQLTNMPQMPTTPTKEQEFCKIQLLTLTDKMGVEFKTSYRVVKSVPTENVNLKKDNYKAKGSSTLYHCMLCPFKSVKIKFIKDHLVYHKPYPNSIKCRYCDFYLPHTLSMNQHEMLHREYEPLSGNNSLNVSDSANFNGNNTVRSILDLSDGAASGGINSVSSTPVKLQNVTLEKIVVHKEKKNLCNLCPYKTVKKRDLLLHQLNHTYRENYLKCRFCDYYFIQHYSMNVETYFSSNFFWLPLMHCSLDKFSVFVKEVCFHFHLSIYSRYLRYYYSADSYILDFSSSMLTESMLLHFRFHFEKCQNDVIH